MAAISLATEGVPVPMGIRQTSAEHLGGVVRVSREGRGGRQDIMLSGILISSLQVGSRCDVGELWIACGVYWIALREVERQRRRHIVRRT